MATEQQHANATSAAAQAEDTQTKASMPTRTGGASAMEREPSRMLRRPGPFSFTRRMYEEMDRLFEDFFGRGFFGYSFAPTQQLARMLNYWPQIELAQRGSKLEIRADLPGLAKDDIEVEVRDNTLTISGERRSEREHERGGVYRSECSYGSFARTIELPESADLDSIEAAVDNGVLKITVEVPEFERRRARQIEVQDVSQPQEPRQEESAQHDTRH